MTESEDLQRIAQLYRERIIAPMSEKDGAHAQILRKLLDPSNDHIYQVTRPLSHDFINITLDIRGLADALDKDTTKADMLENWFNDITKKIAQRLSKMRQLQALAKESLGEGTWNNLGLKQDPVTFLETKLDDIQDFMKEHKIAQIKQSVAPEPPARTAMEKFMWAKREGFPVDTLRMLRKIAETGSLTPLERALLAAEVKAPADEVNGLIKASELVEEPTESTRPPKTWLVTGLTGNLGSAMMPLFHRGDKVYVVSSRPEPDDLKEFGGSLGIDMTWIKADLRKRHIGTDIRRAVGDTPIDVCLLAAGGVLKLPTAPKDFHPQNLKHWHEHQSPNRKVIYEARKSIIDALHDNLFRSDKRSDIVMIGSTLGIQAPKDREKYLNELLELRDIYYWSYAKSELEQLDYATALGNASERAKDQTHVSVLSPGFFGIRDPKISPPSGNSFRELTNFMGNPINHVNMRTNALGKEATPREPMEITGEIQAHLENADAPRWHHQIIKCPSIDIANETGLSEIGKAQLEAERAKRQHKRS